MRALIITIVLSRAAHADDGPRDADVATWLSAGATAASYAAVAVPLGLDAADTKLGKISLGAGGVGILLAPSLGQVYADKYTASGPLVVRIIAIPTAAFGALVTYAECEDVPFECSASAAPWGTGVVIGAGVAFFAATVWELATVGESARAFNRRWRDPPAFSIVPTGSGVAVAGSW